MIYYYFAEKKHVLDANDDETKQFAYLTITV